MIAVDLLTFIEMKGFSRDWEDLGLDDDDLAAMQWQIMARPRGYPVVPGTGGLRKMRFAPQHGARGKRGAIRVCYVYFQEHGIVLLVLAYSKKERDDISPAHKKAIREMIGRQAKEFSERMVR